MITIKKYSTKNPLKPQNYTKKIPINLESLNKIIVQDDFIFKKILYLCHLF